MDSPADVGSWFWGVATVIGPIVLALALAWAFIQYRRRSRDPDLRAARKAAVHDLYHKDAGQPRGR